MNSHTISGRRSITPIIVTIVGLLVALFVGQMVGVGGGKKALILIVPFFAFALGLSLGRNVWYLLPLAFTLQLQLLPIGGGRTVELPEVATLGVFALYLGRLCFKRSSLKLARFESIGIALYVAWVAFVFWQNPVGFSIFGGQEGGARFYFKIALACAAFVVLSNQKISEKDALRVVSIIVLCSLASMVFVYVRFRFFGSAKGADLEGGYTWHQAMSIPALWVVIWLTSRYKPSELYGFARPWAVFFLLCAIALALFSGKRAGLAAVMITPLISAVLWRQYRYVAIAGVALSFLVGGIALGHGRLFEAPYTVQRALSPIPANWDVNTTKLGTGDIFREELRKIARGYIQENPYTGVGGYRIVFREIRQVALMSRDQAYLTALGHAMSGNWHNTWLGIAADFGIPASVFWGIFMLQALIVSFTAFRRYPIGDSRRILGMMIFVFFVLTLLRSWTSGHSALGPMNQWWLYGLAVALKFSPVLRKSRMETAPPHLATNDKHRAYSRLGPMGAPKFVSPQDIK